MPATPMSLRVHAVRMILVSDTHAYNSYGRMHLYGLPACMYV